MKVDYIDIHSHLNLSPLKDNREDILSKMNELNIGTITVGTGFETSQEAIAIAEAYPGQCWATIGIHPTDGDEPFIEEDFLQLAQHEKVVAIGETGLDYFRDQSPEIKQSQRELFVRHISLAQRVGKPLMLHVRSSKGSDDAYYDALELFKEVAYQGKANFHFFSGSMQCMLDIVDAGYTVSVDGPITFVDEYDEMIKAVPLEKVMIETDAPFAAPKPYRGKTCEPWMVVEVARKIAELKELDFELVRAQLVKNSKEFFGI